MVNGNSVCFKISFRMSWAESTREVGAGEAFNGGVICDVDGGVIDGEVTEGDRRILPVSEDFDLA